MGAMVPYRRRSYGRAPQVVRGINWADPLSQSLKMAALNPQFDRLFSRGRTEAVQQWQNRTAYPAPQGTPIGQAWGTSSGAGLQQDAPDTAFSSTPWMSFWMLPANASGSSSEVAVAIATPGGTSHLAFYRGHPSSTFRHSWAKYNGGWKALKTATVPAAGSLNHIGIAILSSSDARVYVNGRLDASSASFGTATNANFGDLGIGGTPSSSGSLSAAFSGGVLDVRYGDASQLGDPDAFFAQMCSARFRFDVYDQGHHYWRLPESAAALAVLQYRRSHTALALGANLVGAWSPSRPESGAKVFFDGSGRGRHIRLQ